MDKYYSYYRVSSKEQREGASLEVQCESNRRYALSKGLEITREFEEVQSASKAGRKQFNTMLTELKKDRDIRGIIFHDVDRSTRSLGDWARINELVEDGYQIHFSREGSDLSGRSARLTADIKAVIASDFSRNLAQEVKKGLYNKLEQGYAVIGNVSLGYQSKGKGIRIIDPIQGQLVRECFDLYATDKYSLKELEEIMYKKGMRSFASGKRIAFNKLSILLHNKFYIGLIECKGKIFKGRHEPLIPLKTFEQVQNNLKRRYSPKEKVYPYKFMHLFSCGHCGQRMKALTAKRKYTYYYCRNKECHMKNVREKNIEKWILEELKKIKFSKRDVEAMVKAAKDMKQSLALTIEESKKSLQLHIENVKAKLEKLLDSHLDNVIASEVYDKKRNELIKQINEFEIQLNNLGGISDKTLDKVEELAELLGNPIKAYRMANHLNKKTLISAMMQKISVFESRITYEWKTPFSVLAKQKISTFSDSEILGSPKGN